MLANASPCCGGCPLSGCGERRVTTDGLGSSGILIVGESPWVDEVREGKPFAGAAGRFLDRTLSRLGLSRDQVLITNALWCKIPRLGWLDKPSTDAALAMKHCESHLDELIHSFNPKVIIPMGNVALRRVCGISGIQSHQAYVHNTKYGIPAVPTFHPSFIMQGNQKLWNAMFFAFQRALEIARAGGAYVRTATEYVLDQPVAVVKEYLQSGLFVNDPIAVDIETPRSSHIAKDIVDEEDPSYEIIRVGFSVRENSACSMPWEEPYISVVKSFMDEATSSTRQWITWNGNFDIPRLKANGVGIRGEVIDAMWCWHFLQSDLPKALDFVAPFFTDIEYWADQNDMQPALYNAVDNDATRRIFIACREHLMKAGRYTRFHQHCVEAYKAMQAMSAAGVLIDRDKQEALRVMLVSDRDSKLADLQTQVPIAVKPRQTYKKGPKVLKPGETMEPLEGGGCQKVKNFNPSSSPQVLSLMRHYGLKIPIKRGTEDQETTESKYLKRYGKKHPVFKTILECRERTKLITSYMWPLHADGRVRTTYGFHPSTWRKSSRGPNLQTIPKRNPELAEKVREVIVAAPGHVLIEADSAAIEAVLTGFLAGDSSYIRMAKMGVHDYLCSHMVGHPVDLTLPDAQVRKLLKAIKRDHSEAREAAKRVVHGSNYCLTPYGIYDEYEEYFSSRKQAKELQEMYFGLFPMIPKWQHNVMERAHRETYLDNVYGYRHYFFDVFSWRNGKWGLGDDAKRCVAFGPQSIASAIQTEDLLTFWKLEGIREWLRLIIHDSVVLEVPLADVEWVCAKVYEVMTRPRMEMDDLTIGAEVKYGASLAKADMTTWESRLTGAA